MDINDFKAGTYKKGYQYQYFRNYLAHVILNETKWSEESLKIWLTQVVFGTDKLVFRPTL